MYDILYVDRAHRETVVASGLGKAEACDLARAEARRRRVGRMFLAGSELGPLSECLVIVHSSQTAVA